MNTPEYFMEYVKEDRKYLMPDGVHMYADQANIPKRFQDAHLHESDASEVAEACRKFVMNFPNGTDGMVLAGPTGLGKTHYACAIVNEIFRVWRPSRSLSMYYFNVNHDLPRLLDKRIAKSYISYQKIIDQLETADLLIVDDLLHVPDKDWVQETLYRIYEARYANEFRTITTLNAQISRGDGGLDWSPISDVFNEAFMRRVVEPAGKNLIVWS